MRKNIDYHAARWDEPLIMQLGTPGERGVLLPACEKQILEETDDPANILPAHLLRQTPPELPEVSQPRVVRHFMRLSQMTMGFDVTPDISQGTCTMKYSPKINEVFCQSPKLRQLHPYQDEETVQGILEIIYKLKLFLCEISGMDDFTFQPGGGSQAIYTNACIIRAYHEANGEGEKRNEIISTAFSHPVDSAAAHTAGFKVITLMPESNGYPSVEALKAAISPRTAGLMITNPEDTGIFNPHIHEFVDLVHEAGGLCSYDQANANGILGIARAREAGFDMCHFNLHKTFSSPHGCIGPGCGAVGVSDKLVRFLPVPRVSFDGEKYHIEFDHPDSIGQVRNYNGNIPAVLRSYAWIMSLGAEGLKRVAEIAVLNNNYLTKKISQIKGVTIAYPEGGQRLEQTRFSWETLTKDTGVTTEDVRRRIVDYGIQSYHTSHHPIIVPEPFTLEPSESFSKEDLDLYVEIFSKVAEEAYENTEVVLTAPHRSTTYQVDRSGCNDPEQWAMTWKAYRRKHLK
ncbi:MAG TPA: aminomethyl-transferring glycine dehydrogenase subunit GcvPB [Syntrophomonadaceae bacterium]|nr:aminomethyl-transferring glycine dehydrogenase subunit GcvPB [Syntrophomonadaceae bacterium]HQA07227.1 aminomethyl-transferring glycine dehydrogenase subunit GcvPB [Syntrophomonadaceae bacterium]HQE22416.1 aminomethyl-transferring glycine dehydrogenase subunit GcvPB [Syntrophomonadaceae bacterium]